MRLENVSSAPRPDRAAHLIPWIAVALGGGSGSLLRWAVTAAEGELPVQTLLINITGSALLAFLAATVFLDRHRPAWLRPFLGTGLLGGFTTFSAVVAFHADARWPVALGYLVVTLVAGLAATAAGDRLGARMRRPR